MTLGRLLDWKYSGAQHKGHCHSLESSYRVVDVSCFCYQLLNVLAFLLNGNMFTGRVLCVALFPAI